MKTLGIDTTYSFKDLPLDSFNSFRYSVYVIDPEWKYLFVNQFVKENLGKRAESLTGKKMWKVFPELNMDPVFNQIKTDVELGKEVNSITISPITGQRLHITGMRLKDCFIFSSSILPKKEDLINELRNTMNK